MDRLATVWLAEQCGMIPGATRGLVLVLGPDGRCARAARWPQGAAEAPDLEALASAALGDDGPLVETRPPRAGAPLACARLAVPFRIGPGRRAAVALEISDSKASEADRFVEQLRAGRDAA